jgi:hypothetical protein
MNDKADAAYKVRALQEDILKKNYETIRAIVEYLREVNSTGHVTPPPPWPKEEVAQLTYGSRLLDAAISAIGDSREIGAPRAP